MLAVSLLSVEKHKKVINKIYYTLYNSQNVLLMYPQHHFMIKFCIPIKLSDYL